MILSKAPMRCSFFGGGSDIPNHYLQWGGSTISMAIDKYVYIGIHPTPLPQIKLSYSKQECVSNVNDLSHDIVRETLKFFNINTGLDIISFSDIPTIGSGLGGSSAFACALVAGLGEYCGFSPYSEYEIAEIVCNIELNLCKYSIGKQDTYASAFGGMNYIKYLTSDRVLVNKMDPAGIDHNMVLIPTNIQRHAAEILDKIDFDEKTYIIRELSLMADLNYPYLPALDLYGPWLNDAWKFKKQMENGISNPEIDNLYDRCMNAGATGAKLLGAGGGGYMLAMTDNKKKIKQEFGDRVCLDVEVAQYGARVVYKD